MYFFRFGVLCFGARWTRGVPGVIGSGVLNVWSLIYIKRTTQKPRWNVCLTKERETTKTSCILVCLETISFFTRLFLPFFCPSSPLPPTPNQCETRRGCVGARYKAESPAVPFRSERSDRCARHLLDNQDLNLLTTMTLLISLLGLTLK